jgi:hypothetical protein
VQIAIALVEAVSGEQKAQSGDIAWLRHLTGRTIFDMGDAKHTALAVKNLETKSGARP